MNPAGSDLQRQALDSWQVIRNRFGLIVLSVLLVFSTAAILTYIMPRKYRGRAEMKIERVANKLQVFKGNTSEDAGAPSDVIIKNEYEAITKPETLYPVVEKLELAKRWNLPTRQAALGKLKGNLETQSSVRSDFVVIEFYDQDAKLAALVANEVGNSYMTRRKEVESKQKQEALDTVDQQIAEQEALRDRAREKMTAAKRAAGIVGDWVSSGSVSTAPGAEIRTAEEGIVGNREQALFMAEQEVDELDAQLQEMKKLNDEELVDRIDGLKLENQSLVSTMKAQYNEAQVKRASLTQEGLGRKHPQVLALDTQIATYKEKILSAARNHVSAMETRLATSRKRYEALQTSNKDAKDEMLDQQSATIAYKTAKDEVAYLDSLLLKLKERASEEKSGLALIKYPATFYAYAEPEPRPAKPNVPLNLALGAILGLVFGIGLAFFLEYMDTSVKSLDDVERFLGVPVLAVIPTGVGVLHRSSGFNPDAEAYRILRTNIEFNRKNPHANCITAVSGGAGEGKSTTMANLAFICAQAGYSVLLIDGDLRRPSMHHHFDVGNSVGLTNYLMSNVMLEQVVVRTAVENLYFMPSGMLPPDSAGLLNSQRMSGLIADAKSRFDLVLIDSPPILGVSDASVLVNEADLTLIVCQHRKLPRHMLMRVKQTVENVGGNVLGVVLNNVDVRTDSQYQYYTSYYTYYSPNNAPTSGGGRPEKRRRNNPAGQPSHAAGYHQGSGGDLY